MRDAGHTRVAMLPRVTVIFILYASATLLLLYRLH